MLKEVDNGTIKEIDGESRVYYEGYWIRYYDVPNNLTYKKSLIDQLNPPGLSSRGNRNKHSWQQTRGSPAQV